MKYDVHWIFPASIIYLIYFLISKAESFSEAFVYADMVFRVVENFTDVTRWST